MDQPTADPHSSKCEALKRELTAEWAKAEADIKRAEQVAEKIVFPSIKELRYAGRRLAESCTLISDGNYIEAEKRLQDAIFDCHRARHDALDAATAKIAADIALMAKTLGYSAITQAFHKFSDLHTALEECRVMIVSSRKETASREQIYITITESRFPLLVELYRELQACEAVIVKIATSERWHVKLLYIGLIVETITIIIGGIELWSKWH